MMKSTLFFVLLFAGPAQAIDYVKCEAMQRAMERTITGASSDIDKSFNRIIRPKCGNRPEKAIMLTIGEEQYLKEDLKWIKCSQAAMNNASHELEKRKISAKWQPKIDKIKSDMKREGCPY